LPDDDLYFEEPEVEDLEEIPEAEKYSSLQIVAFFV